MDTPQPQKQEDHPNLNKGNPGNSGGGVTKYQEDLILKVDEYIKQVFSGESFLHEFFPTIEGFALYIGVDNTDLIPRWANKRYKKDDPKIDPKLRGKLVNPMFHGAITRLKSIQKVKVMNDGMYLGKKVNDRMARFILTVNHSMVETTNTDITTKGKELPVPLLEGVVNVPKDNGSH